MKRHVLVTVLFGVLALSGCGDTGPSLADAAEGDGVGTDASVVELDIDTAEAATDDIVSPEVTLLGHHPEADVDAVQMGTVLWVDLSADVTDAMTLSLSGQGGEIVTGERSVIGPTRIAFEPASFLSPLTMYTATLVWPGGSHSWSFTTREQAYPAVALTPGSSVFKLSPGMSTTMNSVSPPNGNGFVSQIFPLQYLELTVIDEETLKARIAIGDLVAQGDHQNFCQPTADIDTIAFANPILSTEPVDLPHYADLSQMPLGLTAVPVTFQSLQIGAALVASGSGDLSGVRDVSFRGTIDMREMAIGPCASMAGFVPGMQCVGCPEEPAIRECLKIWLTDLAGSLQHSMTLEARTPEQVEADPECGI